MLLLFTSLMISFNVFLSIEILAAARDTIIAFSLTSFVILELLVLLELLDLLETTMKRLLVQLVLPGSKTLQVSQAVQLVLKQVLKQELLVVNPLVLLAVKPVVQLPPKHPPMSKQAPAVLVPLKYP